MMKTTLLGATCALLIGGTAFAQTATPGAGGPADFDKAGDVDGIIVEVDVQDGKFVEVGPVK